MALDYACDFSLLVDMRRAKILVKDFKQMDDVVKALAASDKIMIVSVKNRIGE